MKQKLLAVLIASIAPLMAVPAHAGAVAIANMNVTALGFLNPPGGLALTITNESRTGNASADYNNVTAGGVGPGSGGVSGATTLDIGYRCAGDCATAAGLYNGTSGGLENATNHIAVPGQANYALGDMRISGTAIGGSIQGLTRADAVATGPTNHGSANATIKNGGNISGTFTVGTTFSSAIVVGVDAFLQSWVDPLNGSAEHASADAGYGWNITIKQGNTVLISFAPSELNKSFFSSGASENDSFAYTGLLSSTAATFVKGTTYSFSINQSSNAAITDIPEPTSIALIGIALLGAGAVTRRRMK
nr:EDSAP-1 family PEP-CTERM protein [uncultured Roseateles sp.]